MKDELERVIDAYSNENYLSGSILIEKDGEILLKKAYGEASMQLGIPNSIETKYHIASVTKMFIAAAVLKLEEQGLLDLKQKPSHYIASLENLHPEITLHHLLSHTSGLHDIYGENDLRLKMAQLNKEEGDFLTYLSHLEQQFTPGEKWDYSSTGFIIASYIMEEVTGLKFEQLLDHLFFKPLEMKNTGQDDPKNINIGRAYGHSIEDGKYINSKNDRLADVEAPGELYSTVGDLSTWCNAILNGSVLSEESIEKMFTPYHQTTISQNLKYGYGWFLGKDFRLVAGGTPGFKSEVWQYPEEKTNIIMLWNYEKVDSFELFGKIQPLLIKEKVQ